MGGSPFGIRRFKTDSPRFSKGVATRRAASLSGLHASHLWGPMVFTTTRCLHGHAGITTGNGGLDRMRGRGWDGRGNLRENREDPAPTVGRLRGFHCASHCDPNVAHCRLHTRTMPHMETPVFTTTRHAASLRSSNSCKCLIETFFIARGESPLHKRLNPYGAFGRVPFWNTAV